MSNRRVVVDNTNCGPQAPASCSVQLQSLYQAYFQLVSGAQSVRVQSSDFRSVEYTAGNIEALRALYNQLWDQCGAGSGLPRLVINSVQRGGPARGGC